MMQAQMVRHFSTSKDNRSHQENGSEQPQRIIRENEEPIKNTIFEEAKIGQNVHPAQFEKEKVMSNIDPDTMLKKQ